MAIPIEIQGSSRGNGKSMVEVFNPKIEGRPGQPGITVYTQERILKPETPGPLLNSEFGLALNQNGAFSGTPDPIHDGTDTALWTGSQIAGTKVTFDSTDVSFGGTKSVKIANPSSGDTWQFAKGSNLTVSSFTALTFKLYIDKDWNSGDSVSIFGWDTGSGLQIGTKILIEDYINITTFDVWQSVSVPLDDLSLSGTIDSIRMTQEAKSGPAATWYLDDFQVEETGGDIVFRFQPTGDQLFHISKFAVFVANDGKSEAELQAYDRFYGEPALPNGVAVSLQSRGNLVLAFSEATLYSQITQPQVSVVTGGDGTNSWIKVTSELDFDLDGSKQDFLQYRIQDDLTSLDRYNVWIFGWSEEI